MKTITKFTKSAIIAAIAVEVHGANDPHHVFHASQAVLGQFRREQGALLAELVYTASKASSPVKALAKGFAVLVKRRDMVLDAINTCRVLYDFGKYTLPELGVWSCRMETGIEGAPVWQAVDSVQELMEVLRHDQAQLDLLMAWGRSQAHSEEATSAASVISPEMRKVWEQSLLAIGRAVQKKGVDVVEFLDGVALEWATNSYDAVTQGGKPGAVLRGVADAIRAAINASYFANRNSQSVEAGYALAGVVSGHRTAYGVLFPRTEGGRTHEARDAADGQEAYAGADNILVDVGGRIVDLGSNPSESELQDAIQAYLDWEGQKAQRLLSDAEHVFSHLTCGVKFDGAEYQEFALLRGAVWFDLASKAKERKEAKDEAKGLQQAKLAVQVAGTMDAVSRRVFLATQKHLDLKGAAQLLKEEAEVVAARSARANAVVEAAMALAEEEARKEAVYAATEAQAKAWAAGAKARGAEDALAARRGSMLDRQMTAKGAALATPGYEFTPVPREVMSVAEYREVLRKAVRA